MANEGRVLVLCQLLKTADSVAYTLRSHGLDAVASSDPAEALAALRKQPCDLAIVQVKLNASTGPEFLTQVRKEFPLMQRVLLENEPLDTDPVRLANEAGPCAVLSEPVEADAIWRLLALEGPVSHAASEATASRIRLEAQKVQRKNEQLEAENRLLSQEVTKLRHRLGRAGGGAAPGPVPDSEQALRANREMGVPGEATPKPGQRATDQESLVADLREALERQLSDPNVVLPVLPPIALEIQRLVGRDDMTFDALAERIKQEQSLAARLLQVVNSPAYAGLERTRSVNQAVARLGLQETGNIIQAVLGENLFRTRHRALAKLMAQLWMHSLCVAYANQNIAHRLELPDREDYFAMGLLHDVGRLLILHLAEQAVRARKIASEDLREDVLLTLMTTLHNEFGARLIRKWEYPQAFEDVVALHDDAEGIQKHSEPVVVTYFSNILSRKIGYSLVPYDPQNDSDERLAEVLNITPGTRLLLEDHLKELVGRIRKSYIGT